MHRRGAEECSSVYVGMHVRLFSAPRSMHMQKSLYFIDLLSARARHRTQCSCSCCSVAHARSKNPYKITLFCTSPYAHLQKTLILYDFSDDNPPPFSSTWAGSGRRARIWSMGYRACGVVECEAGQGDLNFGGNGVYGQCRVVVQGRMAYESAQSPPLFLKICVILKVCHARTLFQQVQALTLPHLIGIPISPVRVLIAPIPLGIGRPLLPLAMVVTTMRLGCDRTTTFLISDAVRHH